MMTMATLALAAAMQMDMQEAWKASASDQVHASVSAGRVDGKPAQCLNYDFGSVSGYAGMRREWPVDWPADFSLRAQVQGEGSANSLQLKLVDASGDNVWWLNKPGFAPPSNTGMLKARRRQIAFAWGPAEDHALQRTQHVELVVASSGPGATGGKGRVCLADLSVTPQAPDNSAPPVPRISGSGTRLTVDLGRERDFNGLLLRWAKAPRELSVSASANGKDWQSLAKQATGPLTALWLPESSARWLRLDGDAAMSLAALSLPSPEPGADADWRDRNAMIAALARELPKGSVPRAFLGEQNYWTLVGVGGGGDRSALISEDGAIEVGRGGASVEPQIRMKSDGRWLDWSSAAIGQSLADGDLPVPTVHMAWPGLQLDVTAAAEGPATAPRLLARYSLRNTGKTALTLDFNLLLRPWQVNPPQQFLNTPGGVSEIRSLAWQDGRLSVNGQAFALPLFTPDAVQAAPFSAGLGREALRNAEPLTRRQDLRAMASALMRQGITLAPGETRSLGVVFPLAAQSDLTPPADLDAAIAAAEAGWKGRFSALSVELPPGQQALAQTLNTALAHILISRDGPALRPGTRAYDRSWIRDGAMMVEALVRMQQIDTAREFVDWFAPHIFKNGKVPCCVDAHGADPVAENDSHGEYLFAVATVWRASHDVAWLAKHWPQVQVVVAYMDQLRATTLGTETPAHARGLMPPSISHEGYSDKAAYSFWDDYWALRGYKDAVEMAAALGHADEAGRYAQSRDAFATDLAAAVRNTAARFNLKTLSGAADRGDFDPTSSTMAFDPAQAENLLPPELLANTFKQYAQDAAARADGTRPQGDYTPYELRTVGALVRLGRADDAHALLDFFFADQRPRAWRQWAEVVGREARAPRFLGDMPHAWVSSDFLRSALDLFAYERDADRSLVLGAGITAAWRNTGDVGIRGLLTSCGRLDWRLQRLGAGWVAKIDTACDRQIILRWPGADAPLPRATIAGRELAWNGRELPLPAGTHEVLLTP